MDISSKTYIPNARKWIRFYDDIVNNKYKSYTNRISANQHGGSIASSPSHFMLPIEHKHESNKATSSDLKVNLISPAQQTVEQAKSEITRTSRGRVYKKKKQVKRKVIPHKHRKRAPTNKRKRKVKAYRKTNKKKAKDVDIFGK